MLTYSLALVNIFWKILFEELVGGTGLENCLD